MTTDSPGTLDDEARSRLGRVIDLLAADPTAPSAVRDPAAAWRAHVSDSLTGLEVAELASSRAIADLGSGAGFPGLVLAAAMPARVDLIESVGRKCAFMRRAIEVSGIERARVVCARSEEWAAAGREGREAYDAVTARAVARLSTLAELASPLLAEGGSLVAWKGRRDAEEEAELGRAAAGLAMEPADVIAVGPRAGSEHRHLHVVRKAGPTPDRLPRRAGMAKKRPPGR